jgi:hypothetical protein
VGERERETERARQRERVCEQTKARKGTKELERQQKMVTNPIKTRCLQFWYQLKKIILQIP